MNHIDITFDLETCATTANAAVMQVAAVAWNRSATDNPFLISATFSASGGSAAAPPSAAPRPANFGRTPQNSAAPSEKVPPSECSVGGSIAAANTEYFDEHIDLRTCVVDGFDFDQSTVAWWSGQKEDAKKAVCAGLGEPVEEVFIRFIEWIDNIKKNTHADSVCLWCQGMDFDGAILRNICHKYDLELPFRYQQFRDCRTLILETAVAQVTRHAAVSSAVSGGMLLPDGSVIRPADILKNPCKAYKIFKQLPDGIVDSDIVHDALFDCVRSSWNTWQALRIINGCLIDSTNVSETSFPSA